MRRVRCDTVCGRGWRGGGITIDGVLRRKKRVEATFSVSGERDQDDIVSKRREYGEKGRR